MRSLKRASQLTCLVLCNVKRVYQRSLLTFILYESCVCGTKYKCKDDYRENCTHIFSFYKWQSVFIAITRVIGENDNNM